MSLGAALIGFNRLASFAQGHVAFCFALFWNPMLRVIYCGRNMPFRRLLGDCWGCGNLLILRWPQVFVVRSRGSTCEMF